FKYLDILSAADEEEPEEPVKRLPAPKEKRPTAKKAPAKQARQKEEPPRQPQPPREEPKTSLRTIRRALRSIVRENSEEDEWMIVGKVGNLLLKRYPDFDVRNFGFSKLTPFLDSLDMFEIKSERKDNSGSPQMYVRLKG
ncbi:MAG: OST-HTH/LOTUS domain-containing protein, partial [Acutalibacter sp.]|nr:OST-HTH/LOTUS domain-containing protein [Acutalibacter sp.]